MKNLEEACQRFILAHDKEGCDLQRFLNLLLKAIGRSVPRNVAEEITMKSGKIQNIAEKLLGDDRVSDKALVKIALWNKAINSLNSTHVVAIPSIQFSVSYARYYVADINEKTWESYLKVQRLYDFFVHHYRGTGDIDDLAYSVIFAMIMSGCHFPRAYRAILGTALSDFNFKEQWVLLEKNRRIKPKRGHSLMIRYFLSGFSMLTIMRLLSQLTSEGKKDPDRSHLFPQEFIRKNEKGCDFTKSFNDWLTSLLKEFEQHCTKVMDKEEYDLFWHIETITISDVMRGARLWTACNYPFILTSYLSQKISAGQMSERNFKAYFTDQQVIYADKDTKRSEKPANIFQQTTPERISNLFPHAEENPERVFSDLRELHLKVKKVLSDLPDRASKSDRILAVGEIKELSENIPLPCSTLDKRENGYFSNYRLLLEWLMWLLSQGDVKPDTADAYFGTLANQLYSLLEDICIVSLDRHELADVVFELINSYSLESTKRSVKKKIKSFLLFLTTLYPIANLDWNDPDLWIYKEGTEREIITFSEFDEIFDSIPDLVEPDQVQVLRVLLILLFYGGLRIHEAAQLSTDAIIIDSETYVMIKRSKTRHGKRDLPLHYLVPEKYLSFFRSFVIERRAISGKDMGIPLLSPDCSSFFDPDALAYALTKVIKAAIGRDITCHVLRHSFASLFLLRWYALVYGVEVLKAKYVDWSHPVFTEPELKKLRQLFLGTGPDRDGDLYFLHPVFALKELLGHVSPETTVNTYVHTLDILHLFFLQKNDDKTNISYKRAAALAGGIAEATAKKYFRSSDNCASISKVWRYCYNKLTVINDGLLL